MTQGHSSLAKSIDHTLLRPNAVLEDYLKLCTEAREHGFFSVCVPPSWVATCSKQLNGSSVAVCTVVGFPMGYSMTSTKAIETKNVVAAGATEVDMVLNFSALLSGDMKGVEKDISEVRQNCAGLILKVILETCYLNTQQIEKACKISEAAGANFVKTSTGFGPFGASVEHVQLMRKSVGPKMNVKASGGIRDFAAAKRMLDAGATRLGTSNGVSIVQGAIGGGAY